MTAGTGLLLLVVLLVQTMLEPRMIPTSSPTFFNGGGSGREEVEQECFAPASCDGASPAPTQVELRRVVRREGSVSCATVEDIDEEMEAEKEDGSDGRKRHHNNSAAAVFVDSRSRRRALWKAWRGQSSPTTLAAVWELVDACLFLRPRGGGDAGRKRLWNLGTADPPPPPSQSSSSSSSHAGERGSSLLRSLVLTGAWDDDDNDNNDSAEPWCLLDGHRRIQRACATACETTLFVSRTFDEFRVSVLAWDLHKDPPPTITTPTTTLQVTWELPSWTFDVLEEVAPALQQACDRQPELARVLARMSVVDDDSPTHEKRRDEEGRRIIPIGRRRRGGRSMDCPAVRRFVL